MNTNQIPSVYTPPQGETTVREITTVEKEYDSKGRVTKETTITEKETVTNAGLSYTPYSPTWTGTNGMPITNPYYGSTKYGITDDDPQV